MTITDLDEAKLRMLRLALNRLHENSRWGVEALRLQFSDIMEISGEIDLRISGFEMGEIDVAFEGSGSDEEDDLPALNRDLDAGDEAGRHLGCSANIACSVQIP